MRADEEMSWQGYAAALLVFNLAGMLVVYAIQRLQGFLPLNPQGLAAVTPHLAFNTAASFATNTNWQSYGGETTMSYLTQMLGLTVQNFLSAATGMAVLVGADPRAWPGGQRRTHRQLLGGPDARQSCTSCCPCRWCWPCCWSRRAWSRPSSRTRRCRLLQPTMDADGRPVAEQVLAMGPAASQVAIKQLGTNGGGFFNANSAHPFENPTPLTNFLEMLAILLIPAALCYTFGRMVGDTRQGWALLAAMTLIFVRLRGRASTAQSSRATRA